MLAYFLAILVAITSLVLYLNAFIRPKIHRQDDFLWSGLGLFYALILWVCAGRITGGVLLGQVAGVTVAIAFIWENIQLRSTITAEAESNQVLEGFSLLSFIAQSLTKLSQLGKKKTIPTPPAKTKTQKMTKTEKEEIKVETTDAKENKEEVKSSIDVKEETEDVKETIESIEEKVEESIKAKSIEEDKQQEIDNSLQSISTENISTNEVSIVMEKEEEKQTEKDILTDVKEENKPQVNLLGRIRNIFRKNPEKLPLKDELPESLLDEFDEIDEEIDPETTAVEVEEAIAKLDITEATQENKKETSETNSTSVDTGEKEEVIHQEESILNSEEETDKSVEVIAEVAKEENKVNQISEETDKSIGVIAEVAKEENEVNQITEKMETSVETIAQVTEEKNEVNHQISEETDKPVETIVQITEEENEVNKISEEKTEIIKEEEKPIPPEDTIASLDKLTIETNQEN